MVYAHDQRQLDALLNSARQQPGTTIAHSLRNHYGRHMAWRVRAQEDGHVTLFGEPYSGLTHENLVEMLQGVNGLTTFIYNAKQQVVDAGGSLFETTGLALTDIGNAPVQDVLQSLGFCGMQDALTAALNGRATFRNDFHQAARIYNIHTVPLTYNGPEAPHAVVLVYNISHHYRRLNTYLQQARRYRRLVEHQAQFVIVVRPDRQVVFVNDALCKYAGLPREDLERQPLPAHIMGLPTDTGLPAVFTAVVPTAPRFKLDHPFTRPNGETRWLRWSVQAIFYPHNVQVMEYHAIGTDITEQRAAEEQKHRTEERLQLAVEGAQLAMWDWDIERDTVIYSDAWPTLLGYTRQQFDAIPDACQTLVHPDERAHVSTLLQQHLHGYTPQFHSTHRLRASDDQYVWVMMSGQVIKRNAEGQPLRAAGIMMNVHQQHLATEALQIQHHRLRALVEISAQTKGSYEDRIQGMLRSAATLMGMQIAVLTQISDGTVTYRSVYAPNHPDLVPGRTFPLDVTFCRETVALDQVNAIENAEAIEHFCFYDQGVRAYIGVPVMRNGSLFGTLVLMDEASREPDFNDNDADYMQVLGRWVSTTLEHQRMYDTLAAQEALYRNMITRASDIVYRTDRYGHFTYVNPVGLRLTGYALEELQNMHYSELIPPDDRERIVEFFEGAASKRVDRSYLEFPIVSRGGEVHWIGTSLQLMLAGGEPDGFQGIARDITVQHKAEVEREQMIHELDAFAATVAHDLKNPIHTIMGYAALASESEGLDDETRMIVDRIHRVGAQMNMIVIELLKLAELRSNTIDFEPLNIVRIVKNVLERLDFLVQQTNAQITIAPHFPRTHGYALWIEEAFANYLSNALRYGHQPNEAPRIEVGSIVLDGGRVRYYVHDHGPGIPGEIHHKLFKPRLVKSDNDDSTGLGLSIVQRIIERHGGSVGVDSAPGKGATFYFELPR